MEDLFKELARLEIDLPFSGKITGLKAEFIWQFLRFNENYRRGYDQLKTEDSEDAAYLFAQSWGISSATDYTNERLPHETEQELIPIKGKKGHDKFEVTTAPYFEFSPIIQVRSLSFLIQHGDFLFSDFQNLRLINPHASNQQVVGVLRTEKSVAKRTTIRSVRQSKLTGYIVANHYARTHNLRGKHFTNKYHEVFGTKAPEIFQTNAINKKLHGFDEVSKLAPWCFFSSPHQ